MTQSEEQTEKRPPGRPTKCPYPDRIPDTPENIARILLTTPPPKDGEDEAVEEAA